MGFFPAVRKILGLASSARQIMLFSATLPIYAAAMSTGYAMQDTASTCAVLEAMAGIKRGKAKAKRAGRRSR